MPRGWAAITQDTATGGEEGGVSRPAPPEAVRQRRYRHSAAAMATHRAVCYACAACRRATAAAATAPPPHQPDVAVWTVPLTHEVTRDEGAQHQGPRRHKNTSQN